MTRSDSFGQTWTRLTEWLAVMAPESLAAVRPAVARQGIPQELGELYAHCDGSLPTEAGRFLVSGCGLLGLDEAMALRARLASLVDGPDVETDWWRLDWVPWAANHDGASCLFVDIGTGPGRGSIGYFFQESGGEEQLWPSITAFLEAFAHAVEEGTPFFGETPIVHGGALGWD
ncbi:SMI1/KNR4 family protein [Streptomyces sp. M41(2017)]|uniref:SMI1/KNR4 family protein n=1 Tax=Streptomyces sp. M41(2017) TaxID=1955065 RepID=UPI00117EAC4D|nr:SMI1/KNR4 family protein [Streptomyces sp. M41(2017)]